ncbi:MULTISPECIES: hypothetical protein [Methylomonas]|uniref:Uncharacterized protein n=1 Tax=Methylomonas koyamae TaxID=702114 RepID=A0A291IP51_9GAMM|nr:MULTISPECIES: hypothetical protein [Methylomonas]ANE57076.1 hypothetical protein AYM39_19115 [Methylomonas sp. DH-1]ATG92049.1 hypothetical protein MKLM6_3870 [Methylomonas koyamae]OAI25424.1 hypothetical protein A1356_13215 [Methylomonas koyamae]BBL60280.1 hypothetical protein MKFW12EY_38930 [Methylomonas koyamae]
MINRKSWLAAGLSLSLGGCAAWAVTQDALVDRTAHALGLEKNQFKIENRVDDGVTTRYSVKTDSGQQYNCYVGGSISVLGRMVSEAICSKKGEPARNPLLGQ